MGCGYKDRWGLGFVLFCLVVLVLGFGFFFTQARSLVSLPKNLNIETVKNEQT